MGLLEEITALPFFRSAWLAFQGSSLVLPVEEDEVAVVDVDMEVEEKDLAVDVDLELADDDSEELVDVPSMAAWMARSLLSAGVSLLSGTDGFGRIACFFRGGCSGDKGQSMTEPSLSLSSSQSLLKLPILETAALVPGLTFWLMVRDEL